jgi:hypothetical protein
MLTGAPGALVKHIKNRNKTKKLMLIKITFDTFNVLNAQISRLNFLIYVLN